MNTAHPPTAIRPWWRRPEVPAPPSFPGEVPTRCLRGGRIIIKSARPEADSRGRARKERTELLELVTRN